MGKILLKFLITAYAITTVLLLLLALFVYKCYLPDKAVNACIIVKIGRALAGFLFGKRIGSQKYLWGLCIGGLYFLVLVVVSLCIKGSFTDLTSNFLFTMFLCLASGMLGGMIS